MTDRAAGQRSWTLSPTDLYVSYGSSGQGADWFGPLEPMKPLAPPEVAGRQWDYQPGYNLSTISRPYEPISFAMLRGLADGYDLLRLVIETRKDQVSRLHWTIKTRDKKPAQNVDADRIASVTAILPAARRAAWICRLAAADPRRSFRHRRASALHAARSRRTAEGAAAA